MANKIDAALNRLIEELRAAHGENLVSIVLYGSAATGSNTGSRSNHNLLIALKRITPADLSLSHQTMREWISHAQPMPVYFTAEELKRAADVFPIEFLQMEQARQVLHGVDPFEFVEISRANLRHQTEYELRTKLIQLRRLYVSAADSAEKLSNLMADSLASFAALFRAVLILHGEAPPISKVESVAATVRLLELDGASFTEIFKLRAKTKPTLTQADANRWFGAYMDQIERVIAAVDQLESL